ncbi:hypothetical protein DB31_6244 [Hyalangium minutum]|uniref:Uncharacterized protein n=1 Tax=Hyalangium minutum TaxID=394096 RepID=A0A085VSW0_9BACT|nr:hypothetical protein DB31_6244 [Hyalangium minutum]
MLRLFEPVVLELGSTSSSFHDARSELWMQDWYSESVLSMG